MTILLVIVVGFFALLLGCAIVLAVVHPGSRPRGRDSVDDVGISYGTPHSGIPSRHGGHPDRGDHHGAGLIG
ncbi:hypothetical protein [Nocardia aurantiaca]|uniref:Uncharacterized protein n=1 Tax=Nocardia aurantiaca TaxID=2675850 RepID=A0A6I3L6N0_9NOCA|nr:hypothetical protein [Nocardia aurantiaca]MTE16334.1 hypothetical protein [Nocardia aurantiaca]